MNLLLAGFLLTAAIYGYINFFHKKPQPAIAGPSTVLFDSLIPGVGDDEELEMSFEQQKDNFTPELVEDAETALLFEAQKLLSEIDTIVKTNHDVYAKLHLLLPNYGLFLHTEYYEMLNKCIATILKEDCNLDLTETELSALWNG